jgi:hypothetical protein
MPEHRSTLLQIADAWINCAEEAERETNESRRNNWEGND